MALWRRLGVLELAPVAPPPPTIRAPSKAPPSAPSRLHAAVMACVIAALSPVAVCVLAALLSFWTGQLPAVAAVTDAAGPLAAAVLRWTWACVSRFLLVLL